MLQIMNGIIQANNETNQEQWFIILFSYHYYGLLILSK